MARIELRDVAKRYGAVEVLRDINLDIQDGEFIVLVGPSGCGKSTLLRMIAGLEPITSGDFEIDGQRMNDVRPRDRDIAMVFQSYALYPHMDVARNMGFSMGVQGNGVTAAVADLIDLNRAINVLQQRRSKVVKPQRQFSANDIADHLGDHHGAGIGQLMNA